MSFDNLGLAAPILEAIAEQGYTEPSAIQAESIPAVLAGRDVMAAAQTGTGKTAGFTLPLLELLSEGSLAKRNQARALVLTPTRELAAQVGASVETYGKNLPLRSAVVFGGVKINPQMQKLRQGVDILVATPGRLLDLHNQNAIAFDHLEVLVLDEADRMLDMGFIHDIKRIIRLLPKKRQNLLFSATFSDDIRGLAKGLVNDPVEISVTPRNATATTVEQWVYPTDKSSKSNLLIHLIKDNDWKQVLIFSRTKHGANRISKQLAARGIGSSAIHGNKSQGARTKALADFKSGKIRALVATDIAARGLDIEQLPHVVNFDLPNVPEDYVHRIGRTGRAGATGEAVSLVSADESKLLADIERVIKKLIPRKVIDGFEANIPVPETRLDTRPPKPKKPKSASSGNGRGQSRSNTNSEGPQRRRKPQQGSSHKPGGNGGRSQTANQNTSGGQRSSSSRDSNSNDQGSTKGAWANAKPKNQPTNGNR